MLGVLLPENTRTEFVINAGYNFQIMNRSISSGFKQGVVVVVRENDRWLIIRRATHIVAGGAWCFVGGAIEPQEEQRAAVIREFREEVDGIVRPIRKIWEYNRSDGGLRLHWWLAEHDGGPLRPNPAEVAELRWATTGEIQALDTVLDSNLEFLRRFASQFVG